MWSGLYMLKVWPLYFHLGCPDVCLLILDWKQLFQKYIACLRVISPTCKLISLSRVPTARLASHRHVSCVTSGFHPYRTEVAITGDMCFLMWCYPDRDATLYIPYRRESLYDNMNTVSLIQLNEILHETRKCCWLLIMPPLSTGIWSW